MEVLVARQPIFDRQRNIYGYELLFRSDTGGNAFDGTEAATATMQVLASTLMSIGTGNLLGEKRAFINFDHHLLNAGMYLTLPRDSIVIEVLETVEPTPDLVGICQRIKEQGYFLALDDFNDEFRFAPLTRVADMIKVDLKLSPPEVQERWVETYKRRGLLMLAEKVETYAEFEWALQAGYDLFQGYFFARPAVVRSHQIPTVKSTCLRLLREVQREELDFRGIEKAVRADVSLTYQLLRYVNSFVFPQSARIDSISRALVVMGTNGIRRWVSLATLPMLATDKPSELLTLSLIRARFCERLAELAGAGQPGDAFLLGLFSLLDALLDQPLDVALRSVNLSSDVVGALLGKRGKNDFLADVYQLVTRYERGDWNEVERLSRQCGIPMPAIGQTYLESAVWVTSITR